MTRGVAYNLLPCGNQKSQEPMVTTLRGDALLAPKGAAPYACLSFQDGFPSLLHLCLANPLN